MRRKERDKINTLEEIKNTLLALLRDDPCKANYFVQHKYCPLGVDVDDNNVYRCDERAFIHIIIAYSETVSLSDGWELAVKHVRLLQ